MSPLEELRLLLRPAGGGLHLVSTGLDEQRALQRRLYSAHDDAAVTARWEAALARIPAARAIILGVPSDVGAGFRRGANLGPIEIRKALLDARPDWPARLDAARIVDIGDVLCVPQLLHDEMLSESQKERSRAALYPELPPAVRAAVPVSPLSMAERALDLVFALNPTVKPFVLGGDHSVAWPVASALARAHAGARWGIVQPDAHTDLLEERLGVKYCFATWSFHANELLGRDGRLVQVGIRASRHDRAHWEGTLGVRQFWASACLEDPDRELDAIVGHLRAVGVTGVYFSNDVDGTDSAWASATGTPEAGGLTPDFVERLVTRLGEEIGLLAGDLVEVAPPLQDTPTARADTLALAVRYVGATLSAMAGSTI